MSNSFWEKVLWIRYILHYEHRAFRIPLKHDSLYFIEDLKIDYERMTLSVICTGILFSPVYLQNESCRPHSYIYSLHDSNKYVLDPSKIFRNLFVCLNTMKGIINETKLCTSVISFEKNWCNRGWTLPKK